MISIGEKRAEYEGLEKKIKAKEDELDKLQEEIDELEEDQSKMVNDAYKIYFYEDNEYCDVYLPAEDIVLHEEGWRTNNRWFNYDAYYHYGGFRTGLSPEEIEEDLKKRIKDIVKNNENITSWKSLGDYLDSSFIINPPSKH
ncbi:hypothetical protein IKW73_00610 [Candidatus Saccharibacteria bacterium]|nr:hypothetical protein [Candidatus Saccharibacteria bacterium]